MDNFKLLNFLGHVFVLTVVAIILCKKTEYEKKW